MLVLLSPSKKLAEDYVVKTNNPTRPALFEHSNILAAALKKLSQEQIAQMMDLSPALAQLNHQRFQQLQPELNQNNAGQALFLFKGDVYDNMAIDSYSADELTFAQQHVAILSGLYGLLRPFDLMQAYRLEMGTVLPNLRGKNLYDFWGDVITEEINRRSGGLVVNLASQEYIKAVNSTKLAGKMLTITHKQYKNGQLKTIGLMAKRARGLMCDYIIQNKITTAEALLAFNLGGYTFAPELSSDSQWVFTMHMA